MPRGCPALVQRGDAWRSGASRTHVSRRGDRPASLHVLGGSTLVNSPRSATRQLVLKAPRALHCSAFQPGDLNPHHLVLGVLLVDFEGLPEPLSTSHALLSTGVKAVLSVHGYLVAFIWNLKGSSTLLFGKTKAKNAKHSQKLGHSFYCF